MSTGESGSLEDLTAKNGQNYELVSKTCVVCKRPFKVLSTSQTTTCGRLCLSEATGKPKLASMDWIGATGEKKPPKFYPEEKTYGKLRVATVEELEDYEQTEDSTSKSHQIENRPGRDLAKPKQNTPVAKPAANTTIVVEPKAVLPPAAIQEKEPKEINTLALHTEPTLVGSNEKRWQEYVTRAKAIVSKMANERMEIAVLALEVCQINWGGGDHWEDHKNTHTVKRFAQEVGIAYKTLSNWIRIKRNVYDKLKPLIAISVTQDWAAMVRVADRCKHDDTPEEVLKKFEAWDKHSIKGFNQARYTLQASRRMKSYVHFLEHHAKPKQMRAEDMEELSTNCKAIVKWIKENREEFK